MTLAAAGGDGAWSAVDGPRAGARAAAAVVVGRCAAAGDDAASERATRPRLGVVLGTGLGSLADRLVGLRSLPSGDTGWLAPSTATGHAGRVVCGLLPCGGGPVAMLQGRVHGYEGHPPERLVRGVELLAALGVNTILLTNASGGLRPDMQSGELVVVTDHVDLVRRTWAGGPPVAAGGRVAATLPPGPVYDPRLAAAAVDAARRRGARVRAGVYAHMLGPSYETRAEYRMLRRFAVDCVGMSTVPEAVAARRLGLAVAAVSVVTNVARPDAPARTDAEDVCRAAAAAAEGVWAIIHAVAAAA